MDKKYLCEKLLTFGTIRTKKRKRNKESKDEYYDAGKYSLHVEKVSSELSVYGVYRQTFDAPISDDIWEMMLIQITDEGLSILKKRNENNRFYHDDLFEEELEKIPFGELE